MTIPRTWKKSTYSRGDTQECVEVASHAATGRLIRDSKHPHLGMLGFHSSEWSRFIGNLKRPDAE
ncbi:DUF397 domain-containing protein [Nocardiopsis mwathae]|uniref:DUF397 domain-containing protein n=1 Tax=Nocardiopsis mwathae TaxID=1472723 RepID=UPI00162285DD